MLHSLTRRLCGFDGLPPGTYTIQVLVGHANVSKVLTLPDSMSARANFRLHPERDRIVCRFPAWVQLADDSLFSVTDAAEIRLLRIPKTVRKL